MSQDERVQAAHAEAFAPADRIGHGGSVESNSPENGQAPEPNGLTDRQRAATAATFRQMAAYHARIENRRAAHSRWVEQHADELAADEMEAE